MHDTDFTHAFTETLEEASGLKAAGCRNVTPVLNRIGDKWSVLIVMILARRAHRFNELKREIDGISQRMLTLTLRGLERDGLVSRSVEPTVPPRVTYALTELGQSLIEPVEALGRWAFAHIACIRAAQERFDGANAAAETRPSTTPPMAAPLRTDELV
jgi:DNA-binding HxlR family transcriptional regulator